MENKLTLVENALGSDPNVIIARKIEDLSEKPFLNAYGPKHSVVFYVAPKQGVYTHEGMNEFMNGLLPNTIEHKTYPFSSYLDEGTIEHKGFEVSKGGMFLGEISLTEKMGEGKITHLVEMTIDDELIIGKDYDNVIDGKAVVQSERTVDYMRTIRIRPRPNTQLYDLEDDRVTEDYLKKNII